MTYGDKEKQMRKRIYEIIEVAAENDRLSRVYDIGMMLAIVVSLLPLVTRTQSTWTEIVDVITVTIFIIDYCLRLATADIKIKRGAASFVLYPFTFMAIIDLISILPSLSLLNKSFRMLKLFRLIRSFRVFRIFKTFRYSKNIQILTNVFKKQKDYLLVVFGLAIGYILVSALVMFNLEPETFDNFFEAVYWATISLTSVGYGDIYAVSTLGKFITMVSALFGIAIVALPAGIITAGYMEEIRLEDH